MLRSHPKNQLRKSYFGCYVTKLVPSVRSESFAAKVIKRTQAQAEKARKPDRNGQFLRRSLRVMKKKERDK